MDQLITSKLGAHDLNREEKDPPEVANRQDTAKVLEQHRMYTSHEEPFGCYGKWLWFSNGDLVLHGRTWEKLQPLVKKGKPLLESSRTGEDGEGVIKCYAKENDAEEILNTGLAFQEALEADYLLFFKTNEATKDDCFRRNSYYCITEYMLTPTGKLYKRDELHRWQQMKRMSAFQSKEKERKAQHCSSYRLGSRKSGLPSNVTNKSLLRYNPNPQRYSLKLRGCWILQCDFEVLDQSGLTEVDRAWLKAVDLCSEGIFNGVLCGTKEYAEKNGFKACRLIVFCHGRDVADLDRVKELGCKFLDEGTSFSHPILFNVSSDEFGESKNECYYILTEEKEFYIRGNDLRFYLRP